MDCNYKYKKHWGYWEFCGINALISQIKIITMEKKTGLHFINQNIIELVLTY